jgi:hypothetical protein
MGPWAFKCWCIFKGWNTFNETNFYEKAKNKNVGGIWKFKFISCFTPQKEEGTKEDHWRDLWMREPRTGQQVAQLLDSYMMMMMKLQKKKA